MGELGKVDVRISNHGTIFLFAPQTQEAKNWMGEHVQPDALWYGNALVVEHRFAEDLTAGLLEAGLVVV